MLAIGIAAIITSVFPGLTVKLLQALRLYRKNSLSYEYIEHVTTTGYRSRRCRYYHKTVDGYKNTENKKVWLIMIVMFIVLALAIALLTLLRVA